MNKKTTKIITGFKAGNRRDFERIYRENYQSVYILAMSILKNSSDAEDVVQQTFLKAYEERLTLKDEEKFHCWLSKIAHNESVSLLRKRKPTVPYDTLTEEQLLQLDEVEPMVPQEYVERRELRERVRSIIDDLPPAQREALLLQIDRQLTMKEIGEITETNENTVRSRLFYAKRSIKNKIEAIERRNDEKFYGISLIPLSIIFLKLLQEKEQMSKCRSELIFQRIEQQIYAEGESSESLITALLPQKGGEGTSAVVKIGAAAIACCMIAGTAALASANDTQGDFAGGARQNQKDKLNPSEFSTEFSTELPSAFDEDDSSFELPALTNVDTPNDNDAPAVMPTASDAQSMQFPTTVTKIPPKVPSLEAPQQNTPSQPYNETDYTTAYLGYLDTLYENVDVGNYTEMWRSSSGEPRQVALTDIYGDKTPELFYLSQAHNSEYAELHIVTYADEANEINCTYNVKIDDGFCLFFSGGELYSCQAKSVTKNGVSATEYTYYRYVNSATLDYQYNVLQDVFSLRTFLGGDGSMRYYLPNVSGEVSAAEYRSAENSLLKNASLLLFAENTDKLSSTARSRFNNMSIIGTTFSEASSFLKSYSK